MRTIWKFPLSASDSTVVAAAPIEPLCVQVQHGQPCLWGVVDDEASRIRQRFFVRGTGHTLTGDEGAYIGSFQLMGGGLVFHVFRARPGVAVDEEPATAWPAESA